MSAYVFSAAGQETVGSGRIMTFHKPVSLDLIIKEVKQRLDLKYG